MYRNFAAGSAGDDIEFGYIIGFSFPNMYPFLISVPSCFLLCFRCVGQWAFALLIDDAMARVRKLETRKQLSGLF